MYRQKNDRTLHEVVLYFHNIPCCPEKKEHTVKDADVLEGEKLKVAKPKRRIKKVNSRERTRGIEGRKE